MTDNAIIGGTGFEALAGFEVARRETVDTPYGAPSAALVFGRLVAGEKARDGPVIGCSCPATARSTPFPRTA